MRTTRRTFVKTIGVGALAAAAPRILLGASGDKSGKRDITVGSGDHTYQVIHDWGQLPPGYRYGNTHGVCEDAQHRIYVKNTIGAGSASDDAIVVFDPEGRFIRSWGAEFKGGAHGLHINREGREEFLYLADPPRGVVAKTTLDGEPVWTRNHPEESGLYNSQGEYHPTNIAVVPEGFLHAGDIYVADGYGKSWIHHHNAAGDYLRSFGGPGAERGQVSCPHGLMIDTRGAGPDKEPRLLVADRSNRRLQYFTLGGRHAGFVKDELRSPCHFHFRNGEVVIPDLEARVTIFDKDNKLIVHLGDGQNYALRDKPREQFIPGKFVAPHSAIFDHEGSIFVVEWVEVGRVTKLKKVS